MQDKEYERGGMLKISELNNSFKYFLKYAAIIKYKQCYRLLVIHECKLLTDRDYKTLRGAKIAFIQFYRSRRWREDVQPEWGKFSKPLAGDTNERPALSDDKHGKDEKR